MRRTRVRNSFVVQVIKRARIETDRQKNESGHFAGEQRIRASTRTTGIAAYSTSDETRLDLASSRSARWFAQPWRAQKSGQRRRYGHHNGSRNPGSRGHSRALIVICDTLLARAMRPCPRVFTIAGTAAIRRGDDPVALAAVPPLSQVIRLSVSGCNARHIF